MRFSLGSIVPQPWKNGGGSTRELVAQSDQNGRPLWRVSLAEIDRDGAFSTFPGLARIHCIVAGAGLVLLGADSLRMEAKPQIPLMFDGSLELQAQLRGGPCRAFNLIYDPAAFQAEMQICSTGEYLIPNGPLVVFVLTGRASVFMDGQEQQLLVGDGLHGNAAARITVSEKSRLALVRLSPVSSSLCKSI